MDYSRYMIEKCCTQLDWIPLSQSNEVYDNLFLQDPTPSELHVLVSDSPDDEEADLLPVSKRMTDVTVTSTTSHITPFRISTFDSVIQPLRSRFKVIRDCDELAKHFRTTSGKLNLMHIRQRNSQAPLRVTRDFFDSLLEHGGIFDAVRDSVLYMGRRDLEVEIAPPRPRYKAIQSEQSSSPIGHELVYGLRFFQENHRNDGLNPWSLRQCVIYNKTLNETGSSTWLFVSLPDIAQSALNNHLNENKDEVASRPFDAHLIMSGTIIGLWRPYLVHLATRIDEHTQRLMLASPTGHGPLTLTEDNGERQRQQLKELEDEIIDGILALDSTADTLTSLATFCAKSKEEIPTASHKGQFDTIEAFQERLRDVDMMQKRLIALKEKLASTTQVVSTFLDLGNGYALKTLAERAHEESFKMARLSEKANKDAAAVKALTVITLIYLPITVVLNFFSASFIDTSTGDMKLIGKWWLFMVAGAPLTVFTIIAWRLWLRLHDSEGRKSWRSLLWRRRNGSEAESTAGDSSDPEKCILDTATQK